MHLVYNKRSFYTRLLYFFFLFLGDHKTPRRMKEMMAQGESSFICTLLPSSSVGTSLEAIDRMAMKDVPFTISTIAAETDN